jgi:hypothetical protein
LRVATPKTKTTSKTRPRKPGKASFTVTTADGVVSLVVHDKALVSASGEDAFALYNELFDYVETRLRK